MIQQMFLYSFPFACALKLLQFKGELLYPLVSAYLLLLYATNNLHGLVLKSLPNKLKLTSFHRMPSHLMTNRPGFEAAAPRRGPFVVPRTGSQQPFPAPRLELGLCRTLR